MDILNIKISGKTKNNNPETFMTGIPAMKVGPAKESGLPSFVLNEEAKALLGLYTRKEDNVIVSRLFFTPEYLINGKYLPITCATSKMCMADIKKYKTYKMTQSTGTISSKELYRQLHDCFGFDIQSGQTFVFEKSPVENDDVFIVSLYDFKLDEGINLPVAKEETVELVEVEVEANV